ncbi:MAG: glycosyltransferase family 4 protein [Cellvibrionaceae bacterium]|nr:glycosyltransferase family 4 protein [Cellvibrionaceae bacterium]
MREKIKLLHITFDMNIGGTEQVIRNLIEGLDAAAYESSVLCVDGEVGPWGKDLQAKGIKHFCLQRQPGFDLELVKQVRKIIRENQFDIIHCHQYTPFTYGWFGRLMASPKIVFTEHGRFYPDFSSWKRKIINPVLQSATSAITAISAATKQALVDYENFSAKRIEVIYNGIADASSTMSQHMRTDLQLERNQLVFGTISRLDPIKNHKMMLNAFAEVLQSYGDCRMLIVGDGPIRAELESQAAQLGIAEHTIFTGFQPQPKHYLAIMDVFLLPSFSEGTSMTLLEAMSFSKPSIATAVGGTPEILTHGESGLLIDNDDQPGLVQSMLELAGDPKRCNALGAGARQAYETRFTIANMVDEFQQLYQELLQRN